MLNYRVDVITIKNKLLCNVFKLTNLNHQDYFLEIIIDIFSKKMFVNIVNFYSGSVIEKPVTNQFVFIDNSNESNDHRRNNYYDRVESLSHSTSIRMNLMISDNAVILLFAKVKRIQLGRFLRLYNRYARCRSIVYSTHNPYCMEM